MSAQNIMAPNTTVETIFCMFLIVTKSSKKTKTDNELILLSFVPKTH